MAEQLRLYRILKLKPNISTITFSSMDHLNTFSAFVFFNFWVVICNCFMGIFCNYVSHEICFGTGNASLSNSNQNLGGSSVPAVTPVNPALTSSLIKTVVAQVSQKTVSHCIPLSLVKLYSLPFPAVILTFSSLKYASVPNADPARSWQYRQWHTAPISGFPITLYLRSPQRHPPLCSDIAKPLLVQNCLAEYSVKLGIILTALIASWTPSSLCNG